MDRTRDRMIISGVKGIPIKRKPVHSPGLRVGRYEDL
jgi:hypothetical protein